MSETRQGWEYTYIRSDLLVSDYVAKQVAELGRAGWELVSVTNYSYEIGGYAGLLFSFKRPL